MGVRLIFTERAPILQDDPLLVPDTCGDQSCPGDNHTAVCTLPFGHQTDGWHRDENKSCGWRHQKDQP